FEKVYSRLAKAETILAAAAAHHRLLWIHPFLDGNGRVARLMSHAVLLEALDTGGVWSIARGLARNEYSYKGNLSACDSPRRNDLDGRGALSEEALAAFTQFFLETCLDQVRFMEELVQPNRLRDRILVWAEEEARGGRFRPRSLRAGCRDCFRSRATRPESPWIGDGRRRRRRHVPPKAALSSSNSASIDDDGRVVVNAYRTRHTKHSSCGCAVQEVRGKGQQGSRIGDARRSDRRRLRNGEEGHLGTLESAPSGLRTCWRPHRHRDDRSRS